MWYVLTFFFLTFAGFGFPRECNAQNYGQLLHVVSFMQPTATAQVDAFIHTGPPPIQRPKVFTGDMVPQFVIVPIGGPGGTMIIYTGHKRVISQAQLLPWRIGQGLEVVVSRTDGGLPNHPSFALSWE